MRQALLHEAELAAATLFFQLLIREEIGKGNVGLKLNILDIHY
jgi:hypothetical protein